MNVDLHCHSTASDGALSPTVLVARPMSTGCDLALTDHDTLEGLPKPARPAPDLGMQLVSGVELSCTWGGATIHVLGYDFPSMHRRCSRPSKTCTVAAGCAPKKYRKLAPKACPARSKVRRGAAGTG
jgi:predicted metal-dependent phosphoesterase TrpH